METQNFQLTQEELDHLSKLVTSINFQSVQLIKAELQIEDMRSGIRGLYQAQRQFLDRCMTNHNVDPKKALPDVSIDDKGVMTVRVAPEAADTTEK